MLLHNRIGELEGGINRVSQSLTDLAAAMQAHSTIMQTVVQKEHDESIIKFATIMANLSVMSKTILGNDTSRNESEKALTFIDHVASKNFVPRLFHIFDAYRTQNNMSADIVNQWHLYARVMNSSSDGTNIADAEAMPSLEHLESLPNLLPSELFENTPTFTEFVGAGPREASDDAVMNDQ